MPRSRPVRATLTGSHNALSISTSVVASSQPVCSPPITPAIELGAAVVGDDHVGRAQRIGAAVERHQAFALARPPHHEVALDLARVEDMQRPAAVEGQIVGDVDQRVDRPQPDGAQPPLHPFGRGAVADAAHQPQREGGAERGLQVERHLDRAVEAALDGRDRRRPQRAQPRRREIAGDAGDRRGVGAVRRQVDVDDGVVEPGVGRIGDADRGVVGQFDDAVVILGKLQFRRRAQHAVGLDAADHAFLQGDLLAGDVRADGREHALHAGARIGRPANHLHRLSPGVDDADAQPVGVRMRPGLDDAGGDEALELGARVLDPLDLKADAGERIDDFGEARRGVEMVPEPGEGEFHALDAFARMGGAANSGKCSGRKAGASLKMGVEADVMAVEADRRAVQAQRSKKGPDEDRTAWRGRAPRRDRRTPKRPAPRRRGSLDRPISAPLEGRLQRAPMLASLILNGSESPDVHVGEREPIVSIQGDERIVS